MYQYLYDISFHAGIHSVQGIMTMLQINCEILDTRIIHFNLNT